MNPEISIEKYQNTTQIFSSWESENFDEVKNRYPSQTIEQKVQGVAELVLRSITATQQILQFRSHTTFVSATQEIQQKRDAKRPQGSASIPELIEKATPMERYVIVKVINSVQSSCPSMQKVDVVAASLLFGIGKTHEEISSLSAPTPPTTQQAPTPRDILIETLNRLKILRSQQSSGSEHQFLAVVDQKIQEIENSLDLNRSIE